LQNTEIFQSKDVTSVRDGELNFPKTAMACQRKNPTVHQKNSEKEDFTQSRQFLHADLK
jgi:hypothetical protein